MTAKQLLQELPSDLLRDRMPRHVAVIMDGNGRWAKRRAMPRIMGHRRGVDVLKKLLRTCRDWGIGALTAYAFSTENWGRPTEEVEFLMTLFERVLRQELREMMSENVRIRFAGNLMALPTSLREEIDRAVAMTSTNTGIQFTIATNYGGRQEIMHAVKAIAAQVQSGHLQLGVVGRVRVEQQHPQQDRGGAADHPPRRAQPAVARCVADAHARRQ